MKEGLQALVRLVLNKPEIVEWSSQGLGMLRCYLDKTQSVRMHIWHRGLMEPNVSSIHDHPWDFTSYIVAGRINNKIYETDYAHGTLFKTTRIICGPGGGQPIIPVTDIKLNCRSDHHYAAGQMYKQSRLELHDTKFDDGTITIVNRYNKKNSDEATVAWREGPYVTAEPKPITIEKAQFAINEALKLLR